MNKIKRCIAVMLSLIFALSVCSISASAAEERSVSLAGNQTYSLSDTISAEQVYMVSGRTNNSQYSSQRMRAQCHYKMSVLSSWVYDARVFINIGSSLSQNTESSPIDAGAIWRLGLSPEIEENKGVTGNGVIKIK